MKQRIGISGHVEISHWRDGKRINYISSHNMIVDDGLEYFAWMTKEMLSPSGAVVAPTALTVSVGISDVPARRTDTELGEELSPKVTITTASLPAAPLTNVTQLAFSLAGDEGNPTAPDTIREIGLYGTSTISGVTYTNKMIARMVLPSPGIAKVFGDLLHISWFITFRRKW